MKGIDVSSYQGDIDWTKVKNVDFAFIKATQGSSIIDKKLKQNAVNIAKTNIKFGYYHFATLDSDDVFTDARNEANWFLKAISSLPKPSLGIVLDIEENKLKLPPIKVESWIHTFMDTLSNIGYNRVIYSYTSFLNENLPPTHTFGNYDLWIANYSVKNNPPIPKGFNKWSFWQVGQRDIEGIKGKVDFNITP